MTDGFKIEVLGENVYRISTSDLSYEGFLITKKYKNGNCRLMACHFVQKGTFKIWDHPVVSPFQLMWRPVENERDG